MLKIWICKALIVVALLPAMVSAEQTGTPPKDFTLTLSEYLKSHSELKTTEVRVFDIPEQKVFWIETHNLSAENPLKAKLFYMVGYNDIVGGPFHDSDILENFLPVESPIRVYQWDLGQETLLLWQSVLKAASNQQKVEALMDLSTLRKYRRHPVARVVSTFALPIHRRIPSLALVDVIQASGALLAGGSLLFGVATRFTPFVLPQNHSEFVGASAGTLAGFVFFGVPEYWIQTPVGRSYLRLADRYPKLIPNPLTRIVLKSFGIAATGAASGLCVSVISRLF